MSAASRLAVELTKGDDFLNIWVDANNNGVRDDDDVNIFVSKCGNMFAQSPTFKQALDAHLQQRIKEASIALMTAGHDSVKEEEICELALELVIHACTQPKAEQPVEAAAVATELDAPAATQPAQPQTTAPAWYDAPTAAATTNSTSNAPEYTSAGIPIYRPQA